MKNLILFDNELRVQLLPFTYSRPISEIRIGILTIREKWEHYLEAKASYITQDYLSEKYPINIEDDNLIINGSVIPTPEIVAAVLQLDFDEALLQNGELIAARIDSSKFELLGSEDDIDDFSGFQHKEVNTLKINNLWDIFMLNGRIISNDFQLLTGGRSSNRLSSTNNIIGDPSLIFVEDSVDAEFCTFNTKNGPIYLGKNTTVMENSSIRGPFALCEGAVVKMMAKIYGPTTIGPYCKVGGEINNCVFFGNSNKAHDGYLGNSVLGEWCNLGADTNCSNLKNNYDQIKIWDYKSDSFTDSGLQFSGLIMGDHSKCGINTMFNTGTVVGFSANIFGAGFPRNFVPSFSWGGASGFSTYDIKKATDAAKRVMARRNVEFTDMDYAIFENIFKYSSRYRTWDKKS